MFYQIANWTELTDSEVQDRDLDLSVLYSLFSLIVLVFLLIT